MSFILSCFMFDIVFLSNLICYLSLDADVVFNTIADVIIIVEVFKNNCVIPVVSSHMHTCSVK